MISDDYYQVFSCKEKIELGIILTIVSNITPTIIHIDILIRLRDLYIEME